MKIFKNTCEYCKVDFRSDHIEDLCSDCLYLYYDGKIRMCGKCNHYWGVEDGDCGYTSTDDRGYPVELCSKCEKAEVTS